MENKYYTPSIEEFHVGFECEYKEINSEEWEEDELYYISDKEFEKFRKQMLEFGTNA